MCAIQKHFVTHIFSKIYSILPQRDDRKISHIHHQKVCDSKQKHKRKLREIILLKLSRV
jgi:IS30 family transposase